MFAYPMPKNGYGESIKNQHLRQIQNRFEIQAKKIGEGIKNTIHIF